MLDQTSMECVDILVSKPGTIVKAFAFINETDIGDFLNRRVVVIPTRILTHGQNKWGFKVIALINSFLLVFVSEMGDKTQLLALVLAARFRKPWTVMAGIFVATILNHALAAYVGLRISDYFSDKTMMLVLAISFFVFGLWMLIPDKEGEVKETGHFGAFLTTTISFFIAEMGDKTQLATIALGAQYTNTVLVTFGTTVGMMASNAIAIFFGEKFLSRIPMQWVRRIACALFLLFSVAILIGYFRY